MATVDGYQGREKDLVIVSCVRANREGRGGIGFLSDIRRMNVALTRAKYGLFVVCHALTLRQNRHWSALLDHAQTQGALFGIPHVNAPLIGQPQSQQQQQQQQPQSQSQAHHNKRSHDNTNDSCSAHTDVGVEGVEVTWLPPPKRRKAGKKSAAATTATTTASIKTRDSTSASVSASSSTTAAATVTMSMGEREEGEVD